MNQLKLKQYYPAGGKSEKDIEINNVKMTTRDDVFVGQALLPYADYSQKVVIYKFTRDDGATDLRAISASCPHQGADISNDLLKEDGNVYCSLHRRPICIYSEFNRAFAVELKDQRYIIKADHS